MSSNKENIYIRGVRAIKKIKLEKSGTTVIGNLMWKRCSEGQVWDGKTCKGTVVGYTIQDAKKNARNSSFAGYSNWRLPVIKELNSLIVCSNGEFINISEEDFTLTRGYRAPCYSQDDNEAAINHSLFPNTPFVARNEEIRFWSKSRDESGDFYYVSFDSGVSYFAKKRYNSELNVRLVRIVKSSDKSQKENRDKQRFFNKQNNQ